MPTRYAGSCHCGDVAYEAEGEIAELLECNCSICARQGLPKKLFNGKAL